MDSAKYGFYYKSDYELDCIWTNLCDDCIRDLKKRNLNTPEAKSLFAIARQFEPKIITIFEGEVHDVSIQKIEIV